MSFELLDARQLLAADICIAPSDTVSEAMVSALADRAQPRAAIPAESILNFEVSEDSRGLAVPVPLTDTSTADDVQIEILEPLESALFRIDSDNLVEDGKSFAVEQGQQLRIRGTAFSDVNENGVFDSHSADGRLGRLLFGDTTTADWSAEKVASTLDEEFDQFPFNGQSSLAIDSTRAQAGVQFSYRDGESFDPTGVESVRFWGRADASTTVRISLESPDGRFHFADTIDLGPNGWRQVEIPLSDFGYTSNFVGIYFLTDEASRFYLDDVALMGVTEPDVPFVTANRPDWGVNLFAHEDYTGDAAFTDITRTLRRWGPVDAPWDPPNFSIPFTHQGMPKEPAAAVTHLVGYEPGRFEVRYDGVGEVALRMASRRDGEIVEVPGTRRTEQGKTIFEVDIPQTKVTVMVQLVSVDENNPIRNLQILAPGYHGPNPPKFRDEFLTKISPFSTLRFMDYLGTNNSQAQYWGQRRQANNSIQTGGFTPSPQGGIAWEHVIDMANTTQANAWINIPHRADDNYIRELARLWRDNYDPNLTLIVEFSNEIWNAQFRQYEELGNADYYGTVAPRLVRIRQIFDNIWGARRDDVEVILAGQAANQFQIGRAIKYFEDQGIVPSDVVSAVSVALYANADTSKTYDTVDGLMTDLLDMTDEREFAATLRNTADRYGLKMYAYEGGQHLQAGQASDESLIEVAQSDPRMAEVLQELATIWQEQSGDLFMHYTFTGESSQTSSWGLLTQLNHLGSVKWDAAMDILVERGDADLSGNVDFADFERLSSNFQVLDAWWYHGDFNRDRIVDAADLELFWQNLNFSSITPLQLEEIRSYAADHDVTLTQHEVTLEAPHLEIDESGASELVVTVRRTGNIERELEVKIAISDTTELTADKTVTVPAGQAATDLVLKAVNDGDLDGHHSTLITATAFGYRSSELEVTVRDSGRAIDEQPLPNTRVFLDDNGNGRMDAHELRTFTDARGSFQFDTVPSGAYNVVVDDPRGAVVVRPLGVIALGKATSSQALSKGETQLVEFSFRGTDSDGNARSQGAVTVEIRGENDPPVARSALITAREDGNPVEIQLEANDIDSDNTPEDLKFRLIEAVAEGYVTVTETGQLTFDPGDAFQDLAVGEQRLVTAVYRVTDSHGATDDASVTFVVQGNGGAEPVNPPQVRGVMLASSQWSDAFTDAVNVEHSSSAGYRVPLVTSAAPVPWGGIDQVSIQFDQPVFVGLDDLNVKGVEQLDYEVVDFGYDDRRHLATWTVSTGGNGIPAERLQIELLDSVTNRLGQRLDGEPQEPDGQGVLQFGNGQAGGTWRHELTLLPGDVVSPDQPGSRHPGGRESDHRATR